MLLTETPPQGGFPIGQDDWKLTVEIALPAPGAAKYGSAIYGTSTYAAEVWTDVSLHVAGMSWRRGSDVPGDRPATGTATITLRNLTGEWSPWRSIYYGPGTLMRIAAYNSEGAWIAQFTGSVEQWQYGSEGRYANKAVTIELAETVGAMAWIDANAAALVGAGETSGQRMVRLLDDALWQHGTYDEAASPITLQSTDMTLNRLAELHLTADSTDTWFRSHRSGVAMLEAQNPANHPTYTAPNVARYGSAVYGVGRYSGGDDIEWHSARAGSYYYRRFEVRPDACGTVLPDVLGRPVCRLVYDADTTTPATTDEIVVNEARYANAGGVQQVARNDMSQGRFGRRVAMRNDLKTQQQSDVLTLAQRTVERRSNRSLHIGTVELHARQGDKSNLPGLLIIDVGDPATVVLPDYFNVAGHVTGVEHEITALVPGKSMNWRASLSFETFEDAVPPAVIGGRRMTSYTYVTTPLTPAMRTALGTKVTLIAHIRPSWTEGESLVFGAMTADPTKTALTSMALMLDANCYRDNTGNIVNTYGASDRVLVGGTPTQSGGAFPGVDTTDKWVEVAATFEINTATRHRRIFTRYRSTDPWTVVGTDPETGTATAFSYDRATDPMLYVGNRFQTVAPNWRGGIAAVTVCAGITGTGATATPGGTPIAAWTPEPPDPITTDPYGNQWTVNGPDWSWGTVS